jgi:hypothetical protein
MRDLVPDAARQARVVHDLPRVPQSFSGPKCPCPTAATGAQRTSVSRVRAPEPLSAGAVGDVVLKHATTAGVRDDRRTAHA